MVIEGLTFEFWFTLLLQKVCTDMCIYVCVKKYLLGFTMVIDFKIPAFYVSQEIMAYLCPLSDKVRF